MRQSQVSHGALNGGTNSDTRPAKAGRGNWKIILIQKLVAPDQEPRKAELSGLVEELISHVINPSKAAELVEESPIARIRVKLEVFD